MYVCIFFYLFVYLFIYVHYCVVFVNEFSMLVHAGVCDFGLHQVTCCDHRDRQEETNMILDPRPRLDWFPTDAGASIPRRDGRSWHRRSRNLDWGVAVVGVGVTRGQYE